MYHKQEKEQMNAIQKDLEKIEDSERQLKEMLLIGLLLLDYKATATLMRHNGMTSDDLEDTECFIAAKRIAALPAKERNVSGYLMSIRSRQFSDRSQDERFEFAMACIRRVWITDEFLGAVKFLAWESAAKKGLIG